MKKLLQLLSVGLIAGGSFFASAQYSSPFSSASIVPPTYSQSSFKAEGESSDSYIVFSKAGEPKNIYTLSDLQPGFSVYLYLATEFTVADQQPYIGCNISAVNVMAGSGVNNASFPISSVTAFITDDLSSVPTFKTKGVISTEPFSVTTIPFDEGYEITGEKPLYYGYYMRYSTVCYFMPTDNIPTPSNVNNLMVGIGKGTSTAPTYDNYSYQQPGSLCVSINITGDDLPENSAVPTSIKLNKSYLLGDFSYNLNVKNTGVNNVSSVTVKTSITSGTEYECTVELPSAIKPGETVGITVPDVPNTEEGIFTLTSTITKVNGVEVPNPGSVSGTLTTFSSGYPRRAVIEEATGTWCGWCPRGIVMMEYIRDNYPDWIRIAVHTSDRMSISGYKGWINDFPGPGAAPFAFTNRIMETLVMPSSYYLNPDYEEITGSPTYIKVDLTAECSDDDKTVNIQSVSEVSCDVDQLLQVSFVIVEDGVGPYNQSNYYSGGENGSLSGWEDLPDPTPTIYDDVARNISGYPGDENSLPAQLNKDQKYSYDTSMSISNVKNDSFRVIALITNPATREIINANEITVEKNNSAVKSVAEDTITIGVANGMIVAPGAQNIAVYTLDGRQVANSALAKGVYVVRADGKTAKVYVK